MVSRLGLLCVILLGGCTACGDTWTKPIYPSRQDVLTRGTAEQILIHNESWEQINEGP